MKPSAIPQLVMPGSVLHHMSKVKTPAVASPVWVSISPPIHSSAAAGMIHCGLRETNTVCEGGGVGHEQHSDIFTVIAFIIFLRLIPTLFLKLLPHSLFRI